jgi:hypothetical protein
MWGPGMVPIPMKRVTRWYGYQTAFAVVSADVLMASLLIGASPDYFAARDFSQVAFFSAHVLTGPIVHWSHGYVLKGFGALAINVILPYAFSQFAVTSEYYGAAALTGIGALGAQAIDILWLSRDTVSVPDTDPRGARALLPSSVAILPMIDEDRRGLSLVGRF